MFLNHPFIAQEGEKIKDILCCPNYPGNRPYIDYEKSWEHTTQEEVTLPDGRIAVQKRFVRFIFDDGHQAPIGELHFTDEELDKALRSIESRQINFDVPILLMEPNVKGDISGQNKAWPWERWQELADNYGNVHQQGNPKEKFLRGVKCVADDTFREACAMMRVMKEQAKEGIVFVGTDGGTMHAAAALDIPSVILWSGYSSPKHLGYEHFGNIGHFSWDSPSGSLEEDQWCHANMNSIQVTDVKHFIKKVIG